MKKDEIMELFKGMEELSMEEAGGITGGESAWYWIAYGIGRSLNYLGHSSGQQSGGQLAMNAALG